MSCFDETPDADSLDCLCPPFGYHDKQPGELSDLMLVFISLINHSKNSNTVSFSPPFSFIIAEDNADTMRDFITDHHNTKGELKKMGSKWPVKVPEEKIVPMIMYINASNVYGKCSVIKLVVRVFFAPYVQN